MKLLIAVDKTRFHNLKQFGEKLQKFGIEYKLVDDLDIYEGLNSKYKFLRWIKTPKKFKTLIDGFKPDAVFTERVSHFSVLCIKEKIPLFIYLIGDHWKEIELYDETTKSSFLKKLELRYKRNMAEKCFKESKMIIPVCNYLEKIVKERYPTKKTRVMYQGIEESDWINDDKMELKHPCVGLLQGAKIWGKIKELQILPEVLQKFPDITFYWAGDGQYAKKILPELEKYKNFQWLGILDYPEKVKQYLDSIDIYALISGQDNSPHTLLEAALMKKPIIATNVGGVSESIVDGKTGFLVEKGNPNDIIEKILILLSDEKKITEMGENGYHFVKNNFTWEKIARDFALFLKKEL